MVEYKSGWREIGGIRKYYRSRMEANYARYLQFLKEKGIIIDWQHETKTFWFEKIKRGVRSYLPDFEVIEITGETVFHETKGYMDSRSATKIKRMRIYYPEVRLLVIDKRQYTHIEKALGRAIEGWEY
jgi:hypothetical protein